MPVVSGLVSTVRPSGTGAFGSKRRMGRPFFQDGLRARVRYLAAPATGPDALRARIRSCRLPACAPPSTVGWKEGEEHATLYRTRRASGVRGGRDLGGRERPRGGPDRDNRGGAATVRRE